MADKISDTTPRKEIFATGKSSDLGKETSSKDSFCLLLDRKSLEEPICQLIVLHISRMKKRNSFCPQLQSRYRKRFDPKGKYC
ncbi:hypothetical protein TNCT_530591 [Trichonephila clavata]|uniref:Uncharacterized protein n=1 Tax=Trichonephila clavata TaxID=2740835 RepID=A0A8X6HLX3_TRICU|nr:hypothetical protein TNCT_530591 [Trichonephila clavata]